MACGMSRVRVYSTQSPISKKVTLRIGTWVEYFVNNIHRTERNAVLRHTPCFTLGVNNSARK